LLFIHYSIVPLFHDSFLFHSLRPLRFIVYFFMGVKSGKIFSAASQEGLDSRFIFY